MRWIGLACVAVVASVGVVADCARTSVGLTPLSDLGAGLYLGHYPGGLYAGGSNAIPPDHLQAGVTQAGAIVPRDAAGAPSAGGRMVLLSIGMSNTTQEFCGGSFPNCEPFSFIGQALAHPGVNHTSLSIVDGAAGGQSASTWDAPTDPNYDRVRDTRLAPAGLSEAQVQAIWIKVANPGPNVSLPSAQADAFTLVRQIGDIVRAAKVRYPNLRVAFVSNRIYAGYASTTLNPEPFAYESGFGVKWAIEAQIRQMRGEGVDARAGDLSYASGVAPLLAWGPDLWADGLAARSDGLAYVCADFAADGTHPASGAREKVGRMLLEHLLASPLAENWFRATGVVECPQITAQPQSVEACVRQRVEFSVQATGGAPLAYQWRRNGQNLTGQTGPTLVIANAIALHAAVYTCRVSNACGSVTTEPAVLTLCVGDFNCSGGVPDEADVDAFFQAWNDGRPAADVNASGGTPDDADVREFFERWNEGC